MLDDLPEETRRTWLFFAMLPNTGVDLYPDCMDVFQILPRTTTTSIMRWPLYAPADQRRSAGVAQNGIVLDR